MISSHIIMEDNSGSNTDYCEMVSVHLALGPVHEFIF